jgi:hypothetical protein
MLCAKWYYRAISMVIPIEYYVFRMYGTDGFQLIAIHLAVFLLPLVYYYLEKF